jgi:hypothetical protein
MQLCGLPARKGVNPSQMANQHQFRGTISETWLSTHVHCMIAAEQVMTNRYDVVERAGCSEENNDKRERENYRAVVVFHPKIESGHNLAPGKPIRLPW